jgi:hypothetical protein
MDEIGMERGGGGDGAREISQDVTLDRILLSHAYTRKKNSHVFITLLSLNILDNSTIAGFVFAHTNSPLVPRSILCTGHGRLMTLMTPDIGGVSAYGRHDLTLFRPKSPPLWEKTTIPSGLFTIPK